MKNIALALIAFDSALFKDSLANAKEWLQLGMSMLRTTFPLYGMFVPSLVLFITFLVCLPKMRQGIDYSREFTIGVLIAGIFAIIYSFAVFRLSTTGGL